MLSSILGLSNSSSLSLPLKTCFETNGGNGAVHGQPRTSTPTTISMTRAMSLHPNNSRQRREHGRGNIRNHRGRRSGGFAGSPGATSYRRWSSRRRLFTAAEQRRLSRGGNGGWPPSDELDDLMLNAANVGGGSGSGGGGSGCSCMRVIPLRPHGLFVAAATVTCSALALVASATMLLRNFLLEELSLLPPSCSGHLQNVSFCGTHSLHDEFKA